jgi:hypothetical protein
MPSVNPAIMVWARATAGLTQEVAANHTSPPNDRKVTVDLCPWPFDHAISIRMNREYDGPPNPFLQIDCSVCFHGCGGLCADSGT